MPEEIYISKGIIKKVVTFLNEYIDDPHIVCGYTKFDDHINISVQIWDLNNSILGNNVDCFLERVDSTTNLDLFKIKVKEKINKALQQLND